MILFNIVGSGDIERVKVRIQEKYGFTPPDDYVNDLIEFVTDVASRVLDESDTSGNDDQDKTAE
jgi:hypothetical protein